MAIDSIAMKIGAAAASAGAASPSDGARFAQFLKATPSASGIHANPAEPAREVQGTGSRGSGGTGLGHQILDSLETIYRTSEALRPVAAAPVSSAAAQPFVRTVALAPGPAAAPLAAKPAEGQAAAAPGSTDPADFGSMLRSLEHVYSHAIRVSLVTKTTGSFTSSLNKLMSSA